MVGSIGNEFEASDSGQVFGLGVAVILTCIITLFKRPPITNKTPIKTLFLLMIQLKIKVIIHVRMTATPSPKTCPDSGQVFGLGVAVILTCIITLILSCIINKKRVLMGHYRYYPP
jgi:hypothetical protein